MENMKQNEDSLHRLKAMPFKTRTTFWKVEMANISILPTGHKGTPRVPQRKKFKKIWTRKEAEGKIVNDTLSPHGDMENETYVKAQVHMDVD